MYEGDFTVRLCNLPTNIHSFVQMDIDGFYTITINQNLSRLEQMKRYKHELRHIFNNDFDDENHADCIELEAHRA